MAKILSLFILVVLISCNKEKTTTPIYGDWILTEETRYNANQQQYWVSAEGTIAPQIIRFTQPNTYYLLEDISPYSIKANFQIKNDSLFLLQVMNGTNEAYQNETMRIKAMDDNFLWLVNKYGIESKFRRAHD